MNSNSKLLYSMQVLGPGGEDHACVIRDGNAGTQATSGRRDQAAQNTVRPRSKPASFAIQHNCRAADSSPRRAQAGVVFFSGRLPAVGLGHLLYLLKPSKSMTIEPCSLGERRSSSR